MGVYGELVKLLKNTSALQGVSINLGQEFIFESNIPYPRITLFPTMGIVKSGVGWAEPDAEDANMRWDLDEIIVIHCMARGLGVAPSPAENFDACEVLRQQILSGLQEQRYHFTPEIGPGFYIDITSRKGYWDTDQSIIKVCRAWVCEIQIKISITDQLPTLAPINNIAISEEIDE